VNREIFLPAATPICLTKRRGGEDIIAKVSFSPRFEFVVGFVRAEALAKQEEEEEAFFSRTFE